MSKTDFIRLDANLGFIEKIVLTDGTVLENVKVLYNSPVPTVEQCEELLNTSADVSKKLFGLANVNWSAYPETMVNHSMFKGANQ